MNRSLIKACAGLAGLMMVGLCGSADAAIKPYALTLTPHISGHIYEGNEGLKNSADFGLSLGYNFSRHWAAEVTGTYSELEPLNAPDKEIQMHSVRLDALYHFLPDEDIVPYVVFGGGGIVYDVDNVSGQSGDQDLFTNYGIGVKFFATDRIAIRTDVRHFARYVVENDSSLDHKQTYQNLVVSAGVSFQVGGAESTSKKLVDNDEDGIVDDRDRCLDTPPGYEVDRYGCPVDTDGDGVIDAEDLCADTESGVEVDGNGCAIVIEEPVVEDADGDGVADIDDKCPKTPAGIPVNTYGCPSDSDGDNIFDIDDDCPGTPPGTPVGPDGCGPDEVNIKLRSEDDSGKAEAFRQEHPEKADIAALAEKESLDLGIQFAPNRSVIAPEYQDELQQAAAFIEAHPGASIMVEGHTDSTGSAALNRQLSQKRADTVRWILVRDYGVDPNRIKARGVGETEPIADNSTQQGRAKNRRVIIRAETD